MYTEYCWKITCTRFEVKNKITPVRPIINSVDCHSVIDYFVTWAKMYSKAIINEPLHNLSDSLTFVISVNEIEWNTVLCQLYQTFTADCNIFILNTTSRIMEYIATMDNGIHVLLDRTLYCSTESTLRGYRPTRPTIGVWGNGSVTHVVVK